MKFIKDNFDKKDLRKFLEDNDSHTFNALKQSVGWFIATQFNLYTNDRFEIYDSLAFEMADEILDDSLIREIVKAHDDGEAPHELHMSRYQCCKERLLGLVEFHETNNDGEYWDLVEAQYGDLEDTIFDTMTVHPNSSQSMRGLAVLKGKIVGVVYWSIGFNDCDFDFTVFTHPSYTRIGIGSKLIEMAIDCWDEEYEVTGWDFNPDFVNPACETLTKRLMFEKGLDPAFQAA